MGRFYYACQRLSRIGLSKHTALTKILLVNLPTNSIFVQAVTLLFKSMGNRVACSNDQKLRPRGWAADMRLRAPVVFVMS